MPSGQTVGFLTTAANFTLTTTTGTFIGGSINGSTSITVPNLGWITLQTDGTNWKVISGSPNLLSVAGSRTFTSSGTFTVPNGVTRVKFYVTGGGGGGGYSSEATGSYAYAAGGGSGGTAIGSASVTPGQSISVTIGAAGTGGTSPSPNGTAGGTSSFGSYASATGGAGGTWNSTTFSVGGFPGGAYSTDSNAMLLNGGWGSDGQSGTGSSAYFLGNGAASYWGGGQKAEYGGSSYTLAGAPGSGGGGGYVGPQLGTPGFAGIVRVEW